MRSKILAMILVAALSIPASTETVNVEPLPQIEKYGFSPIDYEYEEITVVENEIDPVAEPIPESVEEVMEYTILDMPANSGFKSYMPYTAITSKKSDQYKLQHTEAYTGNHGIRQVDGRYCIALGSYFGSEIGTYYDLVLENGTVIPCILADQKADIHTDEQNIMTVHNGCVAEFVVDKPALDDLAKRMGDISYCYDEDWNSPVDYVRVY